jgi:hypothetical protein
VADQLQVVDSRRAMGPAVNQGTKRAIEALVPALQLETDYSSREIFDAVVVQRFRKTRCKQFLHPSFDWLPSCLLESSGTTRYCRRQFLIMSSSIWQIHLQAISLAMSCVIDTIIL